MQPNEDIILGNFQLDKFYESNFQYYTTLSDHFKKRFVQRCLHFMESKIISGAEGFYITNKIKAIVSASAVQLTMGHDTWDYDHFMRIIIHPQKFLNKPTQQHFKGETNLQGYIKLSWLSFINGYKHPHDNINLGLHEFSHALRFNSIRGNEQDYYTKYFFRMWLGTAYEAFYHIKKGKQTIFREYGGTNINEFISVCFEHYFESPQQIKKAYPHLYYNTAILLNQITEDNVTTIDVRERMMEEKSKLLHPLKERIIEQSIMRSNTIPLLTASMIIFIFTALVSGLLSGPTLILLIILVLFYLKMDANFIKLHTNGNILEIKKGLLFLKNWKKQSFELSHIVNVQYTEDNDDGELVMVYYNTNDDHFYEEEFLCDKEYLTELLAELKTNKIAISRP